MPDTDPIIAYLAENDAPCPGCGYNLRGLQQSQCPECGRRVRESDLFVEAPSPVLAWLDTLWIIVLFALTIFACFSLMMLLSPAREHFVGTLAMNTLMGTIGGVIPLARRRHGRAWLDPCRRSDLKANTVLMLVTVLAILLRIAALVFLQI